VINGKFLGAPPRGVQRVAYELVRAIDERLSENDTSRSPISWTLLIPAGVRKLDLRHIGQKTFGFGKGLFWEQVMLPIAARSDLLINFCNVAPLFHSQNVFTIHDAQIYESEQSYSWVFKQWYKFLQPKLARRALALTTVSQFSKRQLEKRGIAKSARLEVIHNGLDHILRFEPSTEIGAQGSLKSQHYFLGFASNQRHKNSAMLIDAFLRADIPDFKLVLVGEALSHRLQQYDNIVFLGAVDDHELRALYAGAAFFLFPSMTEGFGLPPGEALACGCPIVVSNGGALEEIYGRCAIVLPAENGRAWTETLRKISRRPDLRREWVERGKTLPQKLTWRAAADQYMGLIEDLLAAR